MAYRRSLSIRSTTLLARRLNPSFRYLSHDNDRSKQEELQPPSGSKLETFLDQRRFSGSFHRAGSTSVGSPLSFHRYMSTSSREIGDEAVFTEAPVNAEAVFTDAPVEAVASQVQTMSEAVITGADLVPPVAALQYFIEGVHNLTGFNWWASIALTTLMIRGATVPFLISNWKATTKFTLMGPSNEEIKNQLLASGECDRKVLKKLEALHKEAFKTVLMLGSVFIVFILAILNMAEKVPSFKTGGAFWFTDLTAPDVTYAFPIFMALTYLAERMGFNMKVADPGVATYRKFQCGVALAMIPLTMSFPQAIFCYCITSNVFGVCLNYVFSIPRVKEALGIPEVSVSPPSQKTQSSFSLSEILKQAAATREESKSLDKKKGMKKK